MPLVMGLIMGILGGPAMALAYRSKGAQKGFDIRKEKFLAGKGKDPAKDPFGPHKPFLTNMLYLGLLMFAVGIAAGFGAQMAAR